MPLGRPAATRATILGWTVAAALAAALVGCTAEPPGRVGAPTPTSPGPSVIGVRELPPLVSRQAPEDGTEPSQETAVSTLSTQIDAALVQEGSPAPATRMQSNPSAGDQLQIAWVFGLTSPDKDSAARVREQTLTVLDLVRAARIDFGTVLLMVTGGVAQANGTTVTTVLRAKYSHGLVSDTDWTAVSPDDVLAMCDDKPAVIAPGYK